MMESSRRWSGFVCPDCRFVFRVPRDHEGCGIVCPCCSRLLRIPVAGDEPSPLVLSVCDAAVDAASGGKIKRKKKSRKGQEQGWEKAQQSGPRGRSREKRQMSLMLIGGAVLLLLMVAGVFAVMSRGNQSNQPAPVANSPAPVAPPALQDPAQAPRRSDNDFLAEAEPLAKKFMSARSVDELLPLVRDPALASARIKAFYPDGKIAASGMSAFNTSGEVTTLGKMRVVMVCNRDFEDKAMAFEESPDGLKIDWECWVGWSEIAWDDFLAKKPSDAALFRVTLSAVEYYNFAFIDEKKWQSYRLISPDQNHALYGYVEKDSPLKAKLQLPPDTKQASFTLALKFPPNATSSSQVIIDKIIADGWLLETGETK